MLRAGVGEGTTALLAGGEIGTAGIDRRQFAAHDLHYRDAEVRVGTNKLLETRNVDQGQAGVFQRDGSSVVRLPTYCRWEPEDAARAKRANEDFGTILCVNGDSAVARADEECSAAGSALSKDLLTTR